MPLNVIQTNEGALNVLVDGIGNTPTIFIHLFDNALAAFTDATVRADVTETGFTGYVHVNPGWSAPAIVGGVAKTDSFTANFTYSGSSTVTIYGFYLTDGPTGNWLGGNLFTSPIVLDTSTTTLQMQVTYTQESKY